MKPLRPIVPGARALVCAILCLAWIAGSIPSAVAADGAGAEAGGDSKPGSTPPPAPAPPVTPGESSPEPRAPAPPPARAEKEPRKETAAGRKKRFFKTPAGAITLAILGAVVAGGLVQSSLGDRNTAGH